MASIPFPEERDEMDAAREWAARHEALIAGRHAGRVGAQSATNPYKIGTADYEDWYRGWHSATAQRVAAELRDRARQCRYSSKPCDCGGRGLCLDMA